MQTDEQLISAYQEGDLEAFEQLYQRHKNGLYRYFYRQVNNASIADELHQDVWMRIVKTSAVFSHQSLFTTWLYKIAHNRLVDYYRSNKLQFEDGFERNFESGFENNINSNNKPASQAEADSQEPLPTINRFSEPDALVQETQIAELVLKAVDELPLEQRETFLLYEHSGLSLKEIANITQVSFESSKSRLRYAVKKLRSQLRNLL